MWERRAKRNLQREDENAPKIKCPGFASLATTSLICNESWQQVVSGKFFKRGAPTLSIIACDEVTSGPDC